MDKPKFVYVTYIRTTQEKLWNALLDPAITKQYWLECWQECEWKKGDSWKLMRPDGVVADAGEVLEIDAPHKLVLRWRNESTPAIHEEGDSRMTYELQTTGETVKLTVIHEIDKPASKFLSAVSTGWPMILASLKSLLETGEPLPETRYFPKDGMCAGKKAAEEHERAQAQATRAS